MLVDIDECSQGVSECTQGCINNIGSYMCDCQTGYYLDSDNYTCLGQFIVLFNKINIVY